MASMMSLAYDSAAVQPLPAPRAPSLPPALPRARLRLVEPEAPEARPAELGHRDPSFIRRLYPLFAWTSDTYYRAEVEGAENLTDRAALMVSTHNGSWATPDMYTLLVAFWRRFGLETPGYGLMHQAVFRVPGIGEAMAKVGALPATRRHGRLALEAGNPLLVCPGGDVDALKPFKDRHQVVFGGRRGFVRLAIETGVPVVPVVSVGAHETMLILNDGRRLAERLGFPKLFRIKSVPLSLSFPLGLTPAGVFSIPLPSKVRVRVLPAIHLGVPRSGADDPEVVEDCTSLIRMRMQRELDDLASRRRFPILG